MKIDKFLQLFVVKEKKFYPMYIEQAEIMEKAAEHLLQILEEPDIETQKSLYKEVKICEQMGDKVTLNIYEELNKTFVTPFDRGDIDELASRMDTILDFIHDSAKRVVMYNPKKLNSTIVEIGKYILEDVRIVVSIMRSLSTIQKNPRPIEEMCFKINDIEHIVDDLYETFMSDIFANERDAIELVKLKNIVQALEDSTDRAKDIANTIRGIIIKFA